MRIAIAMAAVAFTLAGCDVEVLDAETKEELLAAIEDVREVLEKAEEKLEESTAEDVQELLDEAEERLAESTTEDVQELIDEAEERLEEITAAGDGEPQTERERAQRELARLPFPFREWVCDSAFAHIPGACGFDGSGLNRPHFGMWGLPDQLADDARHSPVYHDHDGNDRRIFVGVDQGAEHIDSLGVTGYRGDYEIRLGRLNDGAGYNEVSAYLSQVAPDAATPGSNKVRLIGSSTQREHNRVLAAVRLVNAALPEDSKLSVDPAMPSLSLRNTVREDTYYRDGSELADTIHIEFVPERSWASGGGAAITWADDDHAYVQFYAGSNSYGDDRESVILLAHEMMHALGFDGHVSSSFATIMEGTRQIHAASQGGVTQPMSLLYPVDREALRALYGRLQGSGNSTGFGPWSASSLHLHGNGPHAGFGVALRNGYAEPWAYGYLPADDLSNNESLSGSAVWDGELLGLTPNAAVVAGDASIVVNLASMTGRADFTALETWGADMPPGDEGTGAIWRDGDLGYTIAVRSNTFRETGGDDGRLTGVFTGLSHEGAAGTLERSDFTAAFGARAVTDVVPEAPDTGRAMVTLEEAGTVSGSYVFLYDDWGFEGRQTEENLFGAFINRGSWRSGNVTYYETPPTIDVSGARTGTNPVSGGAVWEGRVRAYEEGGGLAPVSGSTRLEVDFAGATVDVDFTNFDAGTNALSWRGLRVSGGAFQDAAARPTIEGAFYGAGHEGAAGQFHRGSLRGVFGAARN